MSQLVGAQEKLVGTLDIETRNKWTCPQMNSAGQVRTAGSQAKIDLAVKLGADKGVGKCHCHLHNLNLH